MDESPRYGFNEDMTRKKKIFFLKNFKLKKSRYKRIKIKETEKEKNEDKNKNDKPDLIVNNLNKNNLNKIKKERNAGIDLMRLLSMIGIIISHFIYHAKALNKFPAYKKELKLLNILTFWHVDGFALISGIVGYKTHRYANLIYLYLIVLFYSIGIYYYFKYVWKGNYINNGIINAYYPMIFKRYWYFTAYFGMYLILPMINKSVIYLSKYEFTLVVLSTHGIFNIWKDYKAQRDDIFHMIGGYSTLWILILYITGAYIGKYKVDYYGLKKCFFCLIYATFYLIPTYIYYKIYNNEFNLGKGYFKEKISFVLKKIFLERYDSILEVIQAVSLALFLMQIKFNKYLAKIISFFGNLSFAIYIIHEHYLVKFNIIIKIFDKESSNLDLKSTLMLFLSKVFKVLFVCLLVDLFRHLLFTLFRIRKILIYIEAKIKKKFS